MSDQSHPVAADGERDLPEEIASAIEALVNAIGYAASDDGMFLEDMNCDEARVALTTSILSRLTAAEAGREEACRERDDARCVGEANARAADANLAASEAAEAARDAALARVEKLEKALAPFAKMAEPVLVERPSWATPDAYAFRIHPGAVAVTFGDFFRAHDALTEAQPKGDQGWRRK